MPKLTNWSVSARPSDPYEAPELWAPCLVGKVTGHNRIDDGEVITTSTIKSGTAEGNVITASGTIYELGDIDPEYEKEYPGARQRFFDSLNQLSKEKKS